MVDTVPFESVSLSKAIVVVCWDFTILGCVLASFVEQWWGERQVILH